MLDKITDALTGRRLGGALFVFVGLVVAAFVLTQRDDGGSDRAAKPKIQPARLVSVPQLGLAFAHPRTWKRTVAGRVIRLRSPGRAALLTFSSPLEGRERPRVKEALKQALRKRYAPARIVRDGPARLGLHPAASVELQSRARGRNAVRALALVAETRYRTYAVTLLTPQRPSAMRLAEAQKILATVRLTEPVALPAKRRR